MPFNFKNPDYAPVFNDRSHNLARIREDPENLPALKKYYAKNYADFIADWMMTNDPRVQGRSKYMPFLLFPKQIEFIQWLEGLIKQQKDGLVEKTRDSGFTYMCGAFAICEWLFSAGSKTGFGSRKQDLVDRSGDPDSIFEKIRFMIRTLPDEFLPKGFDEKKHFNFMRITNPENGSAITGESGDNIGRGGRSSCYFKDEAQPLDAKILTPDGWSTMRDITIGNQVIGVDGKPTSVIGINECGTHQVYRIHFSDGSKTECSENHMWTVKKARGKKETLNIRAKEIAENYIYKSPKGQVQYRYKIPTCKAIEFNKSNKLPLDPYIIGALLGDGCVTKKTGTPKITTADQEIADEFIRLLPDGVNLSFAGRYEYRMVGGFGKGKSPRGKNNIIKNLLIESEIYGMNSSNKKIPDNYKFSSVNSRISLLQGLLDTDGSASGGVVSFHSTSKELADDTKFIAQSLGATVTHNIKEDKRGFKPVHVLHFALPENINPFRLKRKLESIRKRKNTISRSIINVERIGKEKVKCISVENKDGLYLTNDCIVTHNSAFYERPKLIEAALSENTNVQIDISTVNGVGNPFFIKRHSGKVDVFIFDWRDDPRKDQAWYDNKVATKDADVVAQEIDRDYFASTEGICIPAKYVKAAINLCKRFKINPSGMKIAGFDPADDDESSDAKGVIIRKGINVYYCEAWKAGNVTESTRRAYALCKDERVELLHYDSIGLGAGVKGEIKSLQEINAANGSSYKIKARGINVGKPPTADEYFEEDKLCVDMFANLKAELYTKLSRRFRRTYEFVEGIKDHPIDDLISIPNDPELISELSSFKTMHNEAGKVAIESKAALKKRGVMSPNKAEALAVSFDKIHTTTAEAMSNSKVRIF